MERQYRPFAYKEEALKGVEAIIILGGGVAPYAPEIGEGGSLGDDSLKRTYYGLLLAKKYHLPLIVTGGKVFQGPEIMPEADIAARFLLQNGVKKNTIFIENKSRNTWENALFVKEVFKIKKAILVTSAYHMHRSIYCFTKNNIEVLPAPTDYKSDYSSYSFFSFIPRIHNISHSYKALKEYIGYLYYKLRY